MRSALYYECHVTIDPVFGVELDLFRGLCERYQFRVAKLLMEKGPSEVDSFCTTRGEDYDDVFSRMRMLVHSARAMGYVVRRYKIEDTIVDSRISDAAGLLA